MLAALVPVAAAALAATASLVPFKPAPNQLISSVQMRLQPEQPAPLRTVSLRGAPVAFGEGALEGAPKEGPARPFVLKHTDVKAEVTGFVSSVTVTQEFENPFTEPVEAVYVFPLPDDAAVNEMVLTAGGRVTRATIQKRAEARRRYEQAKSEGRQAALLDQERPNIFTQSVANLLPKESVKVTLTYVARVRYDDGEFVFNFPMVVGPRYIPGNAVPGQSQGTGTARDTTAVLDASRITPPLARGGRDISVSVKVDAGGPIEAMSSVSHKLNARAETSARVEVTLDPSDTIPNKDLVLRWKVAGPARRASLVATGGEGGTFALMVMPPAPEVAIDPLPKEMFFVIDTSCSMGGAPLAAAKRAMQSAMEQMNPADTFMLIDFADTASTFHDTPLLATPQNVQRALGYLRALPASGGTNQMAGLGRALMYPKDRERLRLVLLMTDGFIGNETQIFAAVEQNLGDARIFGFGVGSSVNHYLLGRMSELGRGFYQYVRPDEDPEPAVARFVRRIEKPLLTDVTIDWGSLQVRDVMPKNVPDLFDAQPILLVGRNVNAGKHTVTVKGKLRGVEVTQELDVVIDAQRSGAKGLPAVWARQRIEDLDRQQHFGEKPEVVEAITVLGLEHHLVTAYTSLVAVADEKVAPANPTATVAVPQPPPQLTNGTTTDGTVAVRPPAPGPSANADALKRIYGGQPTTGKDVDGDRNGRFDDADEFDSAFGGGDEEKRSHHTYQPKKVAPYVPPPAGKVAGATPKVTREVGSETDESVFDGKAGLKKSLGQSDIFEVVSSNKPALSRCVEEQRKRDPSVHGKLVVQWRILPSGRVTAVVVLSQEFKQTYFAGCVAGLIKSWTFPKHTVAGDPITFPFKF